MQPIRGRGACPTKLMLDRLPLLFVSEVGDDEYEKIGAMGGFEFTNLII
jgi:hypothetical protein